MALEVLQQNVGEVETTAREELEDLIEEEEEGDLILYHDQFCSYNLFQCLKRKISHLLPQVCHSMRMKLLFVVALSRGSVYR